MPPPYAPYGGAYAGAWYDNARALQADRLTATRQMQASRHSHAIGRRKNLQAFTVGACLRAYQTANGRCRNVVYRAG